MKLVTNFLVLFLVAGCVTSCGTDDSPNEPIQTSTESLKAETILDVSYGDTADQVYDIYLPTDRTLQTKILILIHGGGWTSGDKADMIGFKDFLHDQLPDIAVVNMNYRLADENNAPYPMQTDDISTVVNDLKENRGKYQIGTDLGFVGISAGGHLSLLWSYALDIDKNVKMVCSIVGPTNLLDEAYQNSENEILQGLVNQFGSDDNILEQVSPLFQVYESSPPSLLFYGGQDPVVPLSQGVDLDKKLTGLGVEHEFTLYENEGHGWIGENLFDTSIKLKDFIGEHL